SMDLIDHYEDQLTVNRNESEVMSVNHCAGKTPKMVSPTTFDLIELAVKYSRENFGFNALIGPLVKLWKIGFVGAHVPSDAEDRKSTRLNSSHVSISYAVFCVKQKTQSGGRSR